MNRRGWQLRAASSPAQPVALDGTSARGLLALLASRDDEPAVSARAQLVAALAAGGLDAIRGAMDAARRVLPAPTMTRAEAVAAELAQVFAATQPRALPSGESPARSLAVAQRPELPPPPSPAEVLAALDAALVGELSRSARWNLEHHRRDLARVMGNGAKSLPDFARRAARALDEHRLEVERRRAADEKRQRAPRPSTPPPPEAA